jgi:MFS family permease
MDAPALDDSGGSGAAGGVRAVFRRPRTRMLIIASLFFCVGLLWVQFVSAWVVQKLSQDTRLVQLTGACQTAPLLLGPFLGKFVDAPGRDTAKLELCIFAVVLLYTAGMAAAVLCGVPSDLMSSAGE